MVPDGTSQKGSEVLASWRAWPRWERGGRPTSSSDFGIQQTQVAPSFALLATGSRSIKHGWLCFSSHLMQFYPKAVPKAIVSICQSVFEIETVKQKTRWAPTCPQLLKVETYHSHPSTSTKGQDHTFATFWQLVVFGDRCTSKAASAVTKLTINPPQPSPSPPQPPPTHPMPSHYTLLTCGSKRAHCDGDAPQRLPKAVSRANLIYNRAILSCRPIWAPTGLFPTFAATKLWL